MISSYGWVFFTPHLAICNIRLSLSALDRYIMLHLNYIWQNYGWYMAAISSRLSVRQLTFFLCNWTFLYDQNVNWCCSLTISTLDNKSKLGVEQDMSQTVFMSVVRPVSGQWILAWGRAWRIAPPAGEALQCVTLSLDPPARKTWSWQGFLMRKKSSNLKILAFFLFQCCKNMPVVNL